MSIVVEKIDFLLGDDLAVEQTAFQKFFKKKLKAHGVSSPEDLKGAKKKKFFNEVDRDWKAKNESLSEASVEAIMMQYGPYAAGKKMGILKPKPSGKAGEVKAFPGTSYEYYHPEKTDDKIPGDKTDAKNFKKHDANYRPGQQDDKIPGDKSDVKGFPGKHDVNYNPDKADQKIAGNPGDVKSFPGKQDAHFNPKKQDVKISSKEKVVKTYPGDGKEHVDGLKQAWKPKGKKVPGGKGDIKEFPGDSTERVKGAKTILGTGIPVDIDKRSNMTDPKPLTEMQILLAGPNQPIQDAYEKMIEQSTADVEDTQSKFGPKKYADEAGLTDKDKKKKKKKKDVEDKDKEETASS